MLKMSKSNNKNRVFLKIRILKSVLASKSKKALMTLKQHLQYKTKGKQKHSEYKLEILILQLIKLIKMGRNKKLVSQL